MKKWTLQVGEILFSTEAGKPYVTIGNWDAGGFAVVFSLHKDDLPEITDFLQQVRDRERGL